MGIFTAPEPHFMLHCTKCSLRQTLSVNQTNCHRSGHDSIIGEVRFLAQQRKILVLVIVVVKFIRINRITISTGTSGLLLSFCSAAVSCIMPQKASFSKTFCHKLPDFT
jgi:hypothetical protein